MLGPLLFIIFVNELPHWIITNIRVFADDSKIWSKLVAADDMDDISKLQQDLDNLSNNCSVYCISIHAQKCVITHTAGHSELDTRYYT